MSTGIVKWFNSAKSHGFIRSDDGSADVFVNISTEERAGLTHLGEGRKVRYDVERGRSGKLAVVNFAAL